MENGSATCSHSKRHPQRRSHRAHAIKKSRHERLDETQRNARQQKKGEFMDVKSDGKKFKGIAKEPDKRRK